ncbi:hypothetical protein EJB05_14205, partial [Eragrostis curvula]
MAAPPELNDDAVAEVLLRIPPEDPSCLVRAAVVCKPWRRILCDPAFPRRYREFHRTPPLLGFLRNRYERDSRPQFIPTADASPFSPLPAFDCNQLWTLDCRHGRVLFRCSESSVLLVWDHITGDENCMPEPAHPFNDYAAAVLCAVDGCDHLDCHSGPFVVVVVGADHLEHVTTHKGVCVLIGVRLGRREELSVIDPPEEYLAWVDAIGTSEEGRLRLAIMEDYSLHLWSWQAGANGTDDWVQRVIDLKTLLPVNAPSTSPGLIGYAEGSNTIFMNTSAGAFAMELISKKARKILLGPHRRNDEEKEQAWNSRILLCIAIDEGLKIAAGQQQATTGELELEGKERLRSSGLNRTLYCLLWLVTKAHIKFTYIAH